MLTDSSSNETSKGQSATKTLSSSICFGKLALCEEANLNPRIEGKKLKDSEEAFVFIPAAGISLDASALGIACQCNKLFTKFLSKSLLPLLFRCSPFLLILLVKMLL